MYVGLNSSSYFCCSSVFVFNWITPQTPEWGWPCSSYQNKDVWNASGPKGTKIPALDSSGYCNSFLLFLKSVWERGHRKLLPAVLYWRNVRWDVCWLAWGCCLLVCSYLLDTSYGNLGRGNLNWENATICLAHGKVCWTFSWIIIDVGGANPQQVAWVVEESKLNNSWGTGQ